MPSMPWRPRKYQGHVSSARRRSPQPLHSRISISLPAPACTRLPVRNRRVGPVETCVYLSVTLMHRVGLHLCRAGEITRPHHHHPRIAKKSFPRLSSLLTVSLSSPPPHPPLAAKSPRRRRRLAGESLGLDRAPSRDF
ncbi:unnamed protein product [Urochloa humidicola]